MISVISLVKEEVVESNAKKFDETNRWKLFRNEEKRSENSPDFSGELNINGELYWMDGWVKEGQTKRFFSGTIKPKKNKTAIDEDVPF